MEVWEDVEGYEGIYKVSDKGDVKSLNRTIINKNGKKQFYNGKNLKKSVSNNGYVVFHLCKNNKVKVFLGHRLVAQAFIENTYNKKYVNHKDSVRTNNNFSNLEWVTSSENRVHGLSKGYVSCKKIVAVPMGVGVSLFFDSIADVKRFGFTPSSVSNRINNKVSKKEYKGYYWYLAPSQKGKNYFKPNIKQILNK